MVPVTEDGRPRRVWVAVALLVLFLASVLVRRPLFGKEFTFSWEWLSAHTLLTNQLWAQTPSSVHHFNLLYTFPGATNKFIDDLWQSGVVDKSGNYYYASMPHLAFLTPYLFFVASGQYPTLAGLQIFDLLVHLLVCCLAYLLARRLTRGWRGSRWSGIVAFCVLLFSPTALFFYQNGIVGSVLVIPYTIGSMMAIAMLLDDGNKTRRRTLPWALLFVTLLAGCLTDWQAYFTAFACFAVAVFLGLRNRNQRGFALGVTAVSTLCVVSAISIIVVQDSRINGLQPFLHTVFGRLKVRVGASPKGLGLNSIQYYRNMARFYVAYLPFVLMSAGLTWAAWRRNREDVNRIFRRVSVVLAISVLAVLADHMLLADHTAQQSFTTLNSLVPIAIFGMAATAAFLETSLRQKRDLAILVGALTVCIFVSVGEYYFAYTNRPHPFRAAADTILAATQPGDVIFATGSGFEMPSDYMIPQMLIYLRKNVLVVQDKPEAVTWLMRHKFNRGVLVHIDEKYKVLGTELVSARP